MKLERQGNCEALDELELSYDVLATLMPEDAAKGSMRTLVLISIYGYSIL